MTRGEKCVLRFLSLFTLTPTLSLEGEGVFGCTRINIRTVNLNQEPYL